ncbi:unnamed protein product [Vicia faba]|uniref:Uncharacterized protein n=1 Tax=Vicia faba TaxID=3906 RepID=A0AAV0ZF29_VICFA|nr:unnamed protein product [Vicia faba]
MRIKQTSSKTWKNALKPILARTHVKKMIDDEKELILILDPSIEDSNGESINEIATLAVNNVTEIVKEDHLGARRVFKFHSVESAEKTRKEIGDINTEELEKKSNILLKKLKIIHSRKRVRRREVMMVTELRRSSRENLSPVKEKLRR